MHIQDLVLRCAVTPTLHADVPMLQHHLEDLRKRKQSLLNECGYDRAALMSTAQFCEALESLGVTVKTKISPTGRTIPAIAKTDVFMAELAEYQEADDDTNFRVQTLVNARLAHKSHDRRNPLAKGSCRSLRCRGRTESPCCRCHFAMEAQKHIACLASGK